LFLRLLLLFITVPLLELVILLMLSDATGWRWTLGLVIVTGIAGAWLARRQGFSTWRRIQEELAAGKMPGESLADALMIFVAGALLLTPGLLTDLFGFSLLLPPCRRFYRRWLMQRLKGKLQFSPRGGGMSGADPSYPGDQIIDSYVLPSPDVEKEE